MGPSIDIVNSKKEANENSKRKVNNKMISQPIARGS